MGNSTISLAMFNSYISHQRINPHKIPLNYGFPMVFLWFSYGFPMVFLWFLCTIHGAYGPMALWQARIAARQDDAESLDLLTTVLKCPGMGDVGWELPGRV